LFDHFGNGLIRTTDPENLGADTIFILLSHVCRELWPKNGISVMAALICILLKMPKDARVASSGFSISTFKDIRTAKKLFRDSKTRFTQKTGFHVWTIGRFSVRWFRSRTSILTCENLTLKLGTDGC